MTFKHNVVLISVLLLLSKTSGIYIMIKFKRLASLCLIITFKLFVKIRVKATNSKVFLHVVSHKGFKEFLTIL